MSLSVEMGRFWFLILDSTECPFFSEITVTSNAVRHNQDPRNACNKQRRWNPYLFPPVPAYCFWVYKKFIILLTTQK